MTQKINPYLVMAAVIVLIFALKSGGFMGALITEEIGTNYSSCEVIFRTNAVNENYVDGTWIAMAPACTGSTSCGTSTSLVGWGFNRETTENTPSEVIGTDSNGNQFGFLHGSMNSAFSPYPYYVGIRANNKWSEYARAYCFGGTPDGCNEKDSALLTKTPTEPYSSNGQEVYKDSSCIKPITKVTETCPVIFRTNAADYGSSNSWIVVNGVSAGTNGNGICSGSVVSKTPEGYNVYGDSTSFSIQALSGCKKYTKTTIGVATISPIEPYTTNKQEVFSPTGTQCPLLHKQAAAFCTVNTDCETGICGSNNQCSGAQTATLTMSSPVAGTTYTSSPVLIAATLSDLTNLDRYKVYNNQQLVYETTTQILSYQWNVKDPSTVTANGKHNITVVAYKSPASSSSDEIARATKEISVSCDGCGITPVEVQQGGGGGGSGAPLTETPVTDSTIQLIQTENTTQEIPWLWIGIALIVLFLLFSKNPKIVNVRSRVKKIVIFHKKAK
jgi:hypothetical protein